MSVYVYCIDILFVLIVFYDNYYSLTKTHNFFYVIVFKMLSLKLDLSLFV